MDASHLFLSLILSVVGYAYFTYGRKRPAPVFLIAGTIMMVFGYFVEDIWLMGLITVVLAIGPFFVK